MVTPIFCGTGPIWNTIRSCCSHSGRPCQLKGESGKIGRKTKTRLWATKTHTASIYAPARTASESNPETELSFRKNGMHTGKAMHRRNGACRFLKYREIKSFGIMEWWNIGKMGCNDLNWAIIQFSYPIFQNSAKASLRAQYSNLPNKNLLPTLLFSLNCCQPRIPVL